MELFGVSRICEKRGEHTRARKLYEKSIASFLPTETDRAARRSLARLAKREGDFELPCELWKDALGNSRHGYEAYEQLAIYYEHKARDLEQARQVVRQAINELRRANQVGDITPGTYRGARPLWFFVVMLLPENRTTPELAETIMADVRSACEELDVAIGGGHTEITQGLDRPILVGQMLGEVAPTRLVRKTRIAVGDQILLTQGVAIEGTAILAREKSEQLRRVDADLLARAARFLIEPGISVVSAALAAANVGEAVHGMHDPTEGGLATGLFELVAPAGLGLQVTRERIPVFPETNSICRALSLDPLKLLASGALLVAVTPDGANLAVSAIEDTALKLR